MKSLSRDPVHLLDGVIEMSRYRVIHVISSVQDYIFVDVYSWRWRNIHDRRRDGKESFVIFLHIMLLAIEWSPITMLTPKFEINVGVRCRWGTSTSTRLRTILCFKFLCRNSKYLTEPKWQISNILRILNGYFRRYRFLRIFSDQLNPQKMGDESQTLLRSISLSLSKSFRGQTTSFVAETKTLLPCRNCEFFLISKVISKELRLVLKFYISPFKSADIVVTTHCSKG